MTAGYVLAPGVPGNARGSRLADVTSAEDEPAPSWDDQAFRDTLTATLDGFVQEQAKRLLPLGEDASRLV
ncbi:MAG: hypothetical protein ACRDXB_14540, partial [Actinomycetes bacterium]